MLVIMGTAHLQHVRLNFLFYYIFTAYMKVEERKILYNIVCDEIEGDKGARGLCS